jgi:hypothetical protein
MSMASEPRWKGYAALAAAFVLGAAAGGGVAFGATQHRYARLLGERPGFFEARRAFALSRRLGLNASQQDRVRGIVEQHAERRRQLEREVFERCGDSLRAEQAAVDTEIRAVLEPDQQKRFDQMAKRRERFWRQP